MNNFKRLFCSTLTCLLLCFFVSTLRAQSESFNKGIKWIGALSWEQVKEQAKKENKFIFVDAYTTWCGPCKKMDMEVYTDKNVGEVLNPQFVSVKVQMDQTPKDDEQIKTWYSTAARFSKQYEIAGYPSFLFFNPDGKLVHKALGFRGVPDFIDLVKDALTDPEARYAKSMEKFKNGQLDYQSMPDLAIQAHYKKDDQTAKKIAKYFKEQYVDKLTDEKAFQRKNLGLILIYSPLLINTKDRYFKLFFYHPDLADSITGRNISRQIALVIIRKEEIKDKIYKDGKPITFPEPNWKSYESTIKKKYGKPYVNKIFPDEQISFYLGADDWKNYVKYVNVKIRKTPPKVNGQNLGLQGDAWVLNGYAWEMFLKCSNKEWLERGLPWVDMAIKLDTTAYNSGYYDTKANLLYRMGKVKEAVETEEKAYIRAQLLENPSFRSSSQKEFTLVIEKMKAGLPTWKVLGEKKDQK